MIVFGRQLCGECQELKQVLKNMYMEAGTDYEYHDTGTVEGLAVFAFHRGGANGQLPAILWDDDRERECHHPAICNIDYVDLGTKA